MITNQSNVIRERRDNGSLKDVLNTRRYDIDKILGQGTWGTVYGAVNTETGKRVALKVLNPTRLAREQMERRQLTPFTAMENEGDLEACANIVPRSFEVDENGTPFIRMPEYAVFLDSKLNEEGLPAEKAVKYLGDIAKGLSEMHRIKGRAHSDLKPDNIAIDGQDRLLLNDLGTSTCASLDWTESPRDNMGFIHTRAPECFDEDSHPNERSDVYSLGAIAYKLFGGEYPLQKEFEKAGSPEEFMRRTSDEDRNRIVRNKIRKSKKIPRSLKNLLRRSLDAETCRRPYDGESFRNELEKRLDRSRVLKEVVDATKRLGWVAGIATVVTLGVYGMSVVSGVSSDRGKASPRIDGLLYLENDGVGFDSEQVYGLPGVVRGGGSNIPERYSKDVTDDRSVAYLVHTHRKALDSTRFAAGVTKEQRKIFDRVMDPDGRNEMHRAIDEEGFYRKNGPEVFGVPAIAIEYAIDHLKTEDGNVDLEDVLVMSRLGEKTLTRAKEAAGSDDFVNYIGVRDARGRYIIPEKEQEFAKHWLAYIHDG